jgi:hypothetical protein
VLSASPRPPARSRLTSQAWRRQALSGPQSRRLQVKVLWLIGVRGRFWQGARWSRSIGNRAFIATRIDVDMIVRTHTYEDWVSRIIFRRAQVSADPLRFRSGADRPLRDGAQSWAP